MKDDLYVALAHITAEEGSQEAAMKSIIGALNLLYDSIDKLDALADSSQ